MLIAKRLSQNLLWCILFLAIVCLTSSDAACQIPKVIRGNWYTQEAGENTITKIDDVSMERRAPSQTVDYGRCLLMDNKSVVNLTIVFTNGKCYHCVKLLVRTINVLSKRESGCENLEPGEDPLSICRGLELKRELITMFAENPSPKNCRSSLEGVWHFAYQNRYRFTGECNHEEARISSCQAPGTQFLITNQKFNITYRRCIGMDGQFEGMDSTFDGVVEYSCLGDWFVGKNHFFAVVNTKESRQEEKYRCFLKNRDDDLYIGSSTIPECNILKSPEESPERYRLTPIKSEEVIPGCRLPQNFSGEWVNTANIDAEITINETHIVEIVYPDVGRYRDTIYVCEEQRGNRYMMARLGVDGCQKDYVCFDFVPRHHNIIRYRKGTNLINGDFHTVCNWESFPNQENWKYDLLLARYPEPIRCPIAGKFQFWQKGDVPFETRILGGITKTPIPGVNCKENISDISICDTDQKEIWIDENYCVSVDHLGHPIDIYTDPDYKLQCLGYWQENLKSYLVTYDQSDAFSMYRCWIYQRADLTRILMSQAVGSFCNLNQDVFSWNYTEGANVALEMEEYERERDNCPMYFDDGSDPYKKTERYTRVFTFSHGSSPSAQLSAMLISVFLMYM